MDPTPLMRGVEHLRGRRPQPLVVIGDDQLDTTQAPSASERRNAVQNVSASEAPVATPSTSRRPSVFTPTAIITATETIRPAPDFR